MNKWLMFFRPSEVLGSTRPPKVFCGDWSPNFHQQVLWVQTQPGVDSRGYRNSKEPSGMNKARINNTS